jgi:hypothetical protein
MSYRRKSQHATDAPASRRLLSYSNVAATVAVVLALGGGTAYAAHHYLLSSTKQISPSVLKALKGNAGPAGPKGAQGAQGIQGIQGNTGNQGNIGPQGPGAIVLSDTLTAGAPSLYPNSTGIGAIPVYFYCAREGSGDPQAELVTSVESGGDYYSQYTEGTTFDSFDDNASTYEWDGTLGNEQYLADDTVDADTEHGSVLLEHTVSGNPITETVDFAITEAGTAGTATCTINAQIVSGDAA